MNPETRTKTGRARIAKRARQHGYFHDRENFKVGVRCPLCTERIWTRQPSPSQTAIQVLDAAMELHLRSDCQHGPQQY